MTQFRHVKRKTWGVVTPVNTGKSDGEDIDRIGVTLGLNLHHFWLRGNDFRS